MFPGLCFPRGWRRALGPGRDPGSAVDQLTVGNSLELPCGLFALADRDLAMLVGNSPLGLRQFADSGLYRVRCGRVVVGGGWLSSHRRGDATRTACGTSRCGRCPVWVGRSGLVRGPSGQGVPPSLRGDGRGHGGWEAIAAQGFPIGARYAFCMVQRYVHFSFHCYFKDRTIMPVRTAQYFALP